MPRIAELRVYPLAQTRVNWREARAWLADLGVSDPDAYLAEMQLNATDAESLVMLAGRRCYMSFQPGLNPNVERVRADYADYIDNILRSGHGSVVEHATQTFAVEGVSRVFTGEMNRHRAGWAISEGSMRYIRFEEIPFWMPTSIQPAPGDDPDLAGRKARSRDVFLRAFGQMEENYAEFMRIWDMDEGHPNFGYKKRVTSAARRIVGMGVATGGLWTGNLRAIRHVLDLRCDETAAEEEIFAVFRMIGDYMTGTETRLFGDFERDAANGQWNARYRKV
jgi:thymidylate synthase (FAD)